jgi:hypothetical protein
MEKRICSGTNAEAQEVLWRELILLGAFKQLFLVSGLERVLTISIGSKAAEAFATNLAYDCVEVVRCTTLQDRSRLRVKSAPAGLRRR